MPGPGTQTSQTNALAVCFRLQLQSFVPCGGHYSQEMSHLCPGEGLGRCLTERALQLLPTKQEYYSKGMGRPFPTNLRDRQCKGRRVCSPLLLSKYHWLNGRLNVCLRTQSENFRGTARWSHTSHQTEKSSFLGQQHPSGGKIKILNYILFMWPRDGSSGDSAKAVSLWGDRFG